MTTENAEQFFGIKLRRSLYESPKRHFNWDAYLVGSTVKSLLVKTIGGSVQDVTVLDEEIVPGIGTGATYRFKPALAVSTEVTAYDHPFTNEVDWSRSLYISYGHGISGFAGWVSDSPMVGIQILFAQVGYNFKDDRIDTFIQGMSF